MAQMDLQMDPEEKIARLRAVSSYDEDKFVTILSRKGIIKKIRLSELANIRRNGLRIMNVREGDELLTAHVTDGKRNIFIGTAYGRAICFPEDQFREMGRTAAGVRAIRLKENDYVVGMEIVDADAVILTITENGFVRVTPELRVPGYPNVFAVGDVAATDPLRSSARNRADGLLAHNVRAQFAGRPLRSYRPPKRRWGSVIGIQPDGLEVFAPNGRAFTFPAWSFDRVLMPLIVRWGIYRGVRDNNPALSSPSR